MNMMKSNFNIHTPMTKILFIVIISIILSGCSKDGNDDKNGLETITNTRWISLESVSFMDVFHRKYAGFIAEFDGDKFRISYCDKEIRKDGVHIILIFKGTYSYSGSELTLTTDKKEKLRYTVEKDRMVLIEDDKNLSIEHDIKYPNIFYLSSYGNEEYGDIISKKAWKLTYIAINGFDKQCNIWSNDAAYRNSMDALSKEDNFTISFAGDSWVDYSNGSTFTGKAIENIINGKWKANWLTEYFNIDIVGDLANENDILAETFLTGIANAFSFKGDGNTLNIYYKDGEQIMYMSFRDSTKQ